MQESHSASLRNRLAHQVRDIPRSGIRDFFDIVSTMQDVISLGIGEPDFDTPWCEQTDLTSLRHLLPTKGGG